MVTMWWSHELSPDSLVSDTVISITWSGDDLVFTEGQPFLSTEEKQTVKLNEFRGRVAPRFRVAGK